MEYLSNCCGARPYLNDKQNERCSQCRENCTFEPYEQNYLRVLNYGDTLKKVVHEYYAPKKYHMLNLEEKLFCVGETHKRMRDYVLAQKDQLTQS